MDYFPYSSYHEYLTHAYEYQEYEEYYDWEIANYPDKKRKNNDYEDLPKYY